MVPVQGGDLNIRSVEFVKSSVKLDQCPKRDIPEYAFIGRSNVGKSSLINMICGRKMVARVSSSPGKTQTINHYLINDQWFLVDLPGYGFAKTSRSNRESWTTMIREYLTKRQNLVSVFLLVDSRIKPQESDLQFMEWMAEQEIPFTILMTKIDKLKKLEIRLHEERYKNTLLETWESLPEIILTSSEKRIGRQETWHCILEGNAIFTSSKPNL